MDYVYGCPVNLLSCTKGLRIRGKEGVLFPLNPQPLGQDRQGERNQGNISVLLITY